MAAHHERLSKTLPNFISSISVCRKLLTLWWRCYKLAMPWAEVAGISLPATEVGGDYYDYFVVDGRLAIVCGDVAGHGLASGITLSALRSGFTLLRDELLHQLVHSFRSLVRNQPKVNGSFGRSGDRVLRFILNVSGLNEPILLAPTPVNMKNYLA